MPKKTEESTENVRPAEIQPTITITRQELTDLIAATVTAQKTAETTVGSGADAQVLASAFAGAMSPFLEKFSESQERFALEAARREEESIERAVEERKRADRGKPDPNPPRISVFNPRGDRDFPRPLLIDGSGNIRKCFYSGFPVETCLDRMSHDEINAWNAFKIGKYKAHKGLWTADCFTNGSQEELHVMVPRPDVNQTTPSMLKVLLELQTGEQMPDLSAVMGAFSLRGITPAKFIAALQKIAESLGEAAPAETAA